MKSNQCSSASMPAHGQHQSVFSACFLLIPDPVHPQ